MKTFYYNDHFKRFPDSIIEELTEDDLGFKLLVDSCDLGDFHFGQYEWQKESLCEWKIISFSKSDENTLIITLR